MQSRATASPETEVAPDHKQKYLCVQQHGKIGMDENRNRSMNRPTRTMCISRTGGERFLPTLPAGATLLGTVQRGQQIGALVGLADHTYAQVNGDVLESLNPSQVEHALRSLAPARRAAWPNKTSTPRQSQSGPSAEPAPSKAPVVIIKRRRLVMQPR